LGNLIQNIRVELLYVVEQDEVRSKTVKSSMGLKDTVFVNCAKINDVLDDPRLDYFELKMSVRWSHKISNNIFGIVEFRL